MIGLPLWHLKAVVASRKTTYHQHRSPAAAFCARATDNTCDALAADYFFKLRGGNLPEELFGEEEEGSDSEHDIEEDIDDKESSLYGRTNESDGDACNDDEADDNIIETSGDEDLSEDIPVSTSKADKRMKPKGSKSSKSRKTKNSRKAKRRKKKESISQPRTTKEKSTRTGSGRRKARQKQLAKRALDAELSKPEFDDDEPLVTREEWWRSLISGTLLLIVLVFVSKEVKVQQQQLRAMDSAGE